MARRRDMEKLVQALREQTRVQAGREPTPSAICIESQSVKTPRWVAPSVDTLGARKSKGASASLGRYAGVAMAILMTSAGLDDGVAAPQLLGHITPHDFPCLSTIFADMTYHNHDLDA